MADQMELDAAHGGIEAHEELREAVEQLQDQAEKAQQGSGDDENGNVDWSAICASLHAALGNVGRDNTSAHGSRKHAAKLHGVAWNSPSPSVVTVTVDQASLRSSLANAREGTVILWIQ